MPERILRKTFDLMSQAERDAAHIRGAQIVDAFERPQAARERGGLTFPRSRFDAMTPAEQDAIIAEGARIVD